MASDGNHLGYDNESDPTNNPQDQAALDAAQKARTQAEDTYGKFKVDAGPAVDLNKIIQSAG